MKGVAMIDGDQMRRTFLLLIGAAVLHCALSALTMLFGSKGNGIATVWPANAVLVAMLLAQVQPRWGAVLAGGFIGNMGIGVATGVPALASLAYGVTNMGEVGLAALLLRRLLGDHAMLASPATVGRFILVAGMVAPALSAIGGALIAAHFFGQDFLTSYRIWMWSDGLGLLIFTPISFALFNGELYRGLRDQTWRQRGEMAGLLGLALMAAGYVFSSPFPMLFLLYPTVILIAFRAGRLGTEMAVVLVAATGAILTGAGHGPFAALTADTVLHAHLLQGFLAALLLTCLPVAAALSARGDVLDALTERERLLARKAATDGLTGFLNRAAFRDHAAQALRSMEEQPLCLVAIDLDHFKGVNDRWGHHVGDRALVHMAHILREQLRGGDVIGRTGGDEFMLLLPGTDLSEAERVCHRMRDALRRAPLHVEGGSVALLSISCGVAIAGHGDTVDSLARVADQALYRAKSDGRNAIRRAS